MNAMFGLVLLERLFLILILEGVAFFALEAYDLLTKHGFSPKIIYLSSESDDVDLYHTIIEEFNSYIFYKRKNL